MKGMILLGWFLACVVIFASMQVNAGTVSVDFIGHVSFINGSGAQANIFFNVGDPVTYRVTFDETGAANNQPLPLTLTLLRRSQVLLGRIIFW